MAIKIIFLLMCIAIICLILATYCSCAKHQSKKNPQLRIGHAAPNFELLNQDGQKKTLSDYKGHKTVIYFYPKDETPSCTKQACSLRDGFSELQNANINIVGISFDTVESHKKFKEAYHLPFDLLSDTDKKVATLYETSDGLFGTPKRHTFLIDEKGILTAILKEINVSDHAQQIIEQFKSIDSNQ